MKKLLIGLAVLALACSAHAAVIANYTFTGSSPADSAAYGNMTAGDMDLSSGTMGYSTSSSASWASAGGAVPVADESGGWDTTAQADAKYYYFTVTPSSGYEITITGLNFLYGSTTAGPQTLGWSIDSSAQDSFARASSSMGETYTSAAVSVTVSAATQIRIQGWDGTSTGGNYRLDNVELNGTVQAIPEPATMGLLGLGALVMALRRKIRK